MPNTVLKNKYQKLCDNLASLKSVAVAFSSGVDSTLLLKAAHDTLKGNAIAITGYSPSIPERELKEAIEFCKNEGIEHVIVETHEYEIEGFDHNPEDRCYHCKKELFNQIGKKAAELGVSYIVEGSNMDDLKDYRPGSKAIDELNIASPLCDAGLYKQDIRTISKELGLATWNKQSFACLNTRFEYGDLITEQKLSMVDQAEEVLMELGFRQVRVRMLNTTARIEIMPDDIESIAKPNVRSRIIERFKAIGFRYISVDLQGYRSGSMNEGLEL